jgi:hypothetical protein
VKGFKKNSYKGNKYILIKMAGPTIKLRAKTFGKTEKQKIKILLHRIALVEIENESSFEFHFKKGKTLGLFLKETSCLFMMNCYDKTEELDELRIHDFTTKLKDNPQQYIVISAMCNGSNDHILLANFALEINEIVGGFIDLNGAIIPDLQKDKNENYIHQTHEEYRRYVNAIKGQIHEINNNIDETRKSYSHIVDATWLYNWTLHIDFRLIK